MIPSEAFFHLSIACWFIGFFVGAVMIATQVYRGGPDGAFDAHLATVVGGIYSLGFALGAVGVLIELLN